MDKINLFEDALPAPLFRRLGRAVRTVGMERMEDMGTYSTTFWLPVGTKPTNVVEESVSLLFTVVRPGSQLCSAKSPSAHEKSRNFPERS